MERSNARSARIMLVFRPSIPTDRHPLAMPKLLGGSLQVTLMTNAADVVVSVRTAQCERRDVIGHGRGSDAPALSTVATQRLGSEASPALRLPSATAKTLNHSAP
jgi:hypothetical protein